MVDKEEETKSFILFNIVIDVSAIYLLTFGVIGSHGCLLSQLFVVVPVVFIGNTCVRGLESLVAFYLSGHLASHPAGDRNLLWGMMPRWRGGL